MLASEWAATKYLKALARGDNEAAVYYKKLYEEWSKGE